MVRWACPAGSRSPVQRTRGRGAGMRLVSWCACLLVVVQGAFGQLGAGQAPASPAPGPAPLPRSNAARSPGPGKWRADGQAALNARVAQYNTLNTGWAKNVILFIADGNGIPSNYATRLFEGQLDGGYGDDHVLTAEEMPWLALSKTYTTNAQTPDSAGTGTALNTGVKTKSGVISVDETARRGACETIEGARLTKIAQEMKAAGKKVGIVSTTSITNATPASAYASSVDRTFEAFVPQECERYQTSIAEQLVDAMTGDGAFVDMALGGGRGNFLPDSQGQGGSRQDGRDLIQQAVRGGVQSVATAAELRALDLAGDGRVLGLFDFDHLDYEHDRTGGQTPGTADGRDSSEQPSLRSMTRAAIEFLSTGEDGFFLLVEGGRTDHASHAGNMYRTMAEGIAYQQAIRAAMDLTSAEDTLVVSTADHGHSVVVQGYCGRGSPVDGLCMGIDGNGEANTGQPEIASDGLPFTVITFANGPGSVFMPGGVNNVAGGQSSPGGGRRGGRFRGAQFDDEAFDRAFDRRDRDDRRDRRFGRRDGRRGGDTGGRPSVTNEAASQPDYVQQALVPAGRASHSGTDVAIYATGPWAHLFTGTVEQTFVYYVMKFAAGIGQRDGEAQREG